MALISLNEFSPDTPSGSRSSDLDLSKLWLCKSLKSLGYDRFDVIYILGSWYGSLSLFLLSKHITFDHAVNVDWKEEKTQYVDHVMKRAKLNHKIHAITKDCNDLKYQGENILVINTSTNDIEGYDWFKNIPANTLVALQGRNNQEKLRKENTLKEFNSAYPLSGTLLLDTLVLTGIEDDIYQRFMKIGFK